VLQRALKVVEGEQLDALVVLVCPQLVNMRHNPSAFTKHLNAIERLLREKGIRVQSPEDLSESSTPTS
jgi:pumilio RNA-binding family